MSHDELGGFPPGAETLSRENVLASIAPPIWVSNGPDILVAALATDSVPSFVVLLQNPTDQALEVTVVVSAEHRPNSSLSATLSPLEIGELTLPLDGTAGEIIKLSIGGYGKSGPRVRPYVEGRLDIGRTAVGLAGGLAGLLVVGRGRFTAAMQGGRIDVFQTTVALSLSTRDIGQTVCYRRLWAPDDGRETIWSLDQPSADEPRLALTSIATYGILTTGVVSLMAGAAWMPDAPVVGMALGSIPPALMYVSARRSARWTSIKSSGRVLSPAGEGITDAR